MEKELFLKELEAGNYEIKMEKECGCAISWEIKGGELVKDIDSDCCWVGMVLYMTDADGKTQPILENVAFDELTEVNLKIKHRELREWLEENGLYDRIISEMAFDENSEENDRHEQKELESLVEWLGESECDLYVDRRRGFVNEYTCVLVAKDAEVDDDLESVTAQDWAERYLEKGDAATEYSIGFMMIN